MATTSGEKKSLYKLFVGIIVFAAFLFVWFNPFFRGSGSTYSSQKLGGSDMGFNKTSQRPLDPTIDERMTEHVLPQTVIQVAESITIPPTTRTVALTVDSIEYQISYRDANIPDGVKVTGQTVLLLHGSKFSSKTWVENTKTLQYLAAMGHTAVAVDLPGHGDSPSRSVNRKGVFLKLFIQTLELERPVLISPSMSGSYALPLVLMEPSLLSGYVPVAPAGVANIPEKDLQALQLPTLIVYGEKDSGGAHTSKKLKAIPKSRMYKIKQANHPAYLDNPKLWHQLLYNFLLIISEGRW